MAWSSECPEGNEARKIRYEIVQYTRGRGLDLGCGQWKAYQHFIGVDESRYRGVDVIADCQDLSLFSNRSMDFVFSSHLLEHIQDTLAALREWWRIVKVGGHMLLYLPHKDYYPNIGSEDAHPGHKHDFLPQDIYFLMRKVGGWDLLVNEERNASDEYSFFQVYRKRRDGEHNSSYLRKYDGKTAAVVRYGGFGDMIQASSVLPGLKAQGYRVTFYTTPHGKEIINNDPHIDEWFIQDNDQVPNQELRAFWWVQAEKYDRWVNLSESVEGALLTMPDRVPYYWPTEARDWMLGANYLEFTHKLAGVPCNYAPAFYETEKERQWARKEREKLNGKVVLWCLSGSSVHKAWPYMDRIIARLMLAMPDSKVVLVGDDLSQMLERGWENEPRVLKRCGKWNIRETLAFAKTVDIVVGPETGVLNAVAFLPMPKVITLSHSSPSNLTRDWMNCIALEPEGCKCYPCHQMHYGFEHCSRGEATRVAECQEKISIEAMWDAILIGLKGEGK